MSDEYVPQAWRMTGYYPESYAKFMAALGIGIDYSDDDFGRYEAEFRADLAAHDAEVRASVVAEEPDWEYGFTSKWGTFAARDQISAEQKAATIRTEIEAGRSSGDLTYHGRVMKRTTAKAGPWIPVTPDD